MLRFPFATPGWTLIASILTVAVAAPALAHNAPSADAGQRHISLAVEPGRVRLAYTIIFGHAASAAARARMDRSGDGSITAAETDAYTAEVARELAGHLVVTVDGVPQTLAFDERYANAESDHVAVDLVAELSLAGGGEHTVALRDSFELPGTDIGQLAVVPRDVTITEAGLAARSHDGPKLVIRWRETSPLATTPYELRFHAGEGPTASAPSNIPKVERGPVSGGIAIAIAAAILALALAWILFRQNMKG